MAGRSHIDFGSGVSQKNTNLNQLAERHVDRSPDNWVIKSGPNWVAVMAKTLGWSNNEDLVSNEDHVLLLPRSNSLIQPQSLEALWYFLEVSEANLSFDQDVGFYYQQVTIVGVETMEDGIDAGFEQKLRTDTNRQVERMRVETANQLIDELQKRRDENIYFRTE